MAVNHYYEYPGAAPAPPPPVLTLVLVLRLILLLARVVINDESRPKNIPLKRHIINNII